MPVHDAARPVVATVTSMDEYQGRLLGAAHTVLAQRDIPLITHVDGPYARGAGSELLVSLLRRSAPRGVITMNQVQADDQHRLLSLVAELDVPVVHIGIELPDAASVRGDNASGMRELLAHLFDDRGIRRPVLVRGSLHQPDSVIREHVFREELVRRGINVDEELVITGEFTSEVTYLALRTLLETRRDMDAIVALNDPMAHAALMALEDVGLRVPEDVLVTGYDDDQIARRWPGLTTVDQQLETQGEAVGTLLLEQLDGQMPRSVVVPSVMVERGSTAADDDPVSDLHTAIGMARLGQQHLATQAGILATSRALGYCWTVDQTVNTLGDHLARLGVTRCFLALYEREDDPNEKTLAAMVETNRARLVLDHREGQSHHADSEPFASHRLLPDSRVDELDKGLLILQPLAVLDRPIGYVLFEQAPGVGPLSELMRIDLSRTIDGVLTTQEGQTRAATLERVIARRTRELRKEAMTRQRAEHQLEQANVRLRRSAMIDGLTQIANHEAFQEYLDEHWRRQIVEGGQIAVILVDVDHFKFYNDHYGHLAGDDALRAVASCLERSVRDGPDVAGRYGGEEFVAVLPRGSVEGALAVANRFQAFLADLAIPHEASPVAPTVTVSIGIAVAMPYPGTDAAEVVAAADRAMYQAKAAGRDRVVIGESLVAD